MCGYLNLEILLVKQVTLTWVKFVKSNGGIEKIWEYQEKSTTMKLKIFNRKKALSEIPAKKMVNPRSAWSNVLMRFKRQN